jgi:uncharacterized membrane protein
VFFGTPFLSFLVDLQVDSLIVCGGSTSGCVRASVVDALDNLLRRVAEGCFDRLQVSHATSRSTCSLGTPTWSPAWRCWTSLLARGDVPASECKLAAMDQRIIAFFRQTRLEIALDFEGLLTCCSLTALFWSGNFVIGRGILGRLPRAGVRRWVVAFSLLLPFALGPMLLERETIRRHWKMLVVLGVLGVGSFNTLVYIGLGSTTATNGLLLNSSIPVLIVALGWMFFGQHVTPRQGLGIVLSLCGVVAIISKGNLQQLLGLQLNPGDLWAFSAMVTWALYTLLLRRRPAKLSA